MATKDPIEAIDNDCVLGKYDQRVRLQQSSNTLSRRLGERTSQSRTNELNSLVEQSVRDRIGAKIVCGEVRASSLGQNWLPIGFHELASD